MGLYCSGCITLKVEESACVCRVLWDIDHLPLELHELRQQSAKVDDFRGPAETAQAIMEDDTHPMHAKFMSGDDAVHKHVDNLLAKARDMIQ